jgi:hypothetical protein
MSPRRQRKKKGDGDTPEWNRLHPAKKLLYDELATGNIPLTSKEMGPKEVYEKYSDTAAFQLKGMEYGSSFTRRLRSLRNQIKRDKNRAAEDKAALQIALKNYPVPLVNQKGEPQWNGSDAQKLLEQDMLAELHLKMMPVELHSTRES